MKRILVTGGAGFIGSHLIDFLVRQTPFQIVVVDNLKRGRISNLAQTIDHIRFIDGDIRDRELMRSAAQGMDVIFHLAAQSNVIGAVQDIDYSFTSNVVGTLEVLLAAKQCGVRRVVFASSREVYGEPRSLPVTETASLAPKNAYGASKAAAEMYCQVLSSEQTSIRILRLANVYGQRDFDRVIPIFLDQALANHPLTIYGGQQILDFVWIDAVVEALMRAADLASWPGPINVGSGKPTTIWDLASKVVSLVGSSSEIRIEGTRDIEVATFVACTEQMQRVLGIMPPADPLFGLSSLVESLACESV